MKHLALLLTSFVAALIFTSCGTTKICGGGCHGCGKSQKFPHQGCESQRFVEKQITEFVEEEVVIEGKGPKGGLTTETITVRRPVVKTVREKVHCTDCGSKFCPHPDCCGIVPKSVLSRATAQGGTGEPHLGLIPTMKVLVSGARDANDL